MKATLLAALAAVCTLSLSTLVEAAPPQAAITGSTGGQPGDILVLDASESGADWYKWMVTPKLQEGRPTILVLEGGRKCLVTSVPGTWTIFMACGNADGIDMAEWVVEVSENPSPGPPPQPFPNPDPEPEPEPAPPEPDVPEIPVGVFDTARLAHQLSQTVDSDNRVAEAHALAGSFESVAASIAAGAIKSEQAILLALLSSNASALGDKVKTWAPVGNAIGVRLQELHKSGRLKTLNDWSVCLREISIGFAAVK